MNNVETFEVAVKKLMAEHHAIGEVNLTCWFTDYAEFQVPGTIVVPKVLPSASAWKHSRFAPPHTDKRVLGRRMVQNHDGLGMSYLYAVVVRRNSGFGTWEWGTENGRVPLSYWPEWMEIPE